MKDDRCPKLENDTLFDFALAKLVASCFLFPVICLLTPEH
jgi:hypothetical protein